VQHQPFLGDGAAQIGGEFTPTRRLGILREAEQLDGGTRLSARRGQRGFGAGQKILGRRAMVGRQRNADI